MSCSPTRSCDWHKSINGQHWVRGCTVNASPLQRPFIPPYCAVALTLLQSPRWEAKRVICTPLDLNVAAVSMAKPVQHRIPNSPTAHVRLYPPLFTIMTHSSVGTNWNQAIKIYVVMCTVVSIALALQRWTTRVAEMKVESKITTNTKSQITALEEN